MSTILSLPKTLFTPENVEKVVTRYVSALPQAINSTSSSGFGSMPDWPLLTHDALYLLLANQAGKLNFQA
jgi:hypothetical protein